MRTTLRSRFEPQPVSGKANLTLIAAAGLLAALALLSATGCTSTQGATNASSSTKKPTTMAEIGARMAGPRVDVHVTKAALASAPKTRDLSSPQSAVRAYLDWTSFAYRVSDSSVASATMTADEGVRVDSYNQYNLEKKRLIDQKLTSLILGTPSSTATTTLVPAREQWVYSYISIETAGKVIGGPYTASYESTYTVVKQNGDWVVAKVDAKALGTVK